MNLTKYQPVKINWNIKFTYRTSNFSKEEKIPPGKESRSLFARFLKHKNSMSAYYKNTWKLTYINLSASMHQKVINIEVPFSWSIMFTNIFRHFKLHSRQHFLLFYFLLFYCNRSRFFKVVFLAVAFCLWCLCAMSGFRLMFYRRFLLIPNQIGHFEYFLTVIRDFQDNTVG